MRVYADTSFLVRLLADEPETERAIADYRRLGRPAVFFLPLHALEVANAIRQRAFHLRQTARGLERAAIMRETKAAFDALAKFISRRAFIQSSADTDKALEVASALSVKHTERLGCRGFDLLHIALALELGCEKFLTSDGTQGSVARAEGLEVTLSSAEGGD